ncbi:VOC family protein [Streptomyces ardesiacus]|uniref:VOC family protein n=1 Tax=Streptomyces ardesiacus TaxID=285564 RepID=UPI00201F4A78|nr:VOC family protein [Streptomyces ardesiacus]MCL7366008.1 VOC family protein [Streptomyces ardesiacus]
MVRVQTLNNIALAVPDLDRAQDFYVDRWGLAPVNGDGDGRHRYFRTQTSAHHGLSLEQAPSGAERGELVHISFDVATRADLDAAVEAAVAAGGQVEREPGEAVGPGHEAGAAFRDPDGNVVWLLHGATFTEESHRARIVAPRKLGHIVLNTPRRAVLERFYASLGLRVSDRTARGMSFMRCNRDHHSLALCDSERTGVQHIAFDVVEMDSVMTALGALTREGTPCVWGPGRHGPGNNIFTYYADPAGVFIEYYAELEQVEEEMEGPLEARFWGPEWKGDTWGYAGPPPANFTK